MTSASDVRRVLLGANDTGREDDRAVCAGDAALELDRLEVWRALVAPRDADAFARRMQWDGDLHLASRERSCTPDHLAPRDAVSAAACDMPFDAEMPQPFEALFSPIVRSAREALRVVAGLSVSQLLSSSALRALEQHLLLRCTRICARALFVEFSVFRALRQQSGYASVFGAPVRTPSTKAFDAFMESQASDSMASFWSKYPVARQLCSRVAHQWVEMVAEFAGRLQDDLPRLADIAGETRELGPVSHVVVGAGDSHDGGRAVMIVDFASGARLVYKPRATGLEVVLRGLIEWINARHPAAALRSPRILSRETHGWIEFMTASSCHTLTQVKRFHERCGMLLALTYAMNGTDFHLENLIAVGEHPVLIDAEALFGLRFDLLRQVAGVNPGASAVARQVAEGSVLNVHLLPSLKIDNAGAVFEVGGIGGRASRDAETEVSYWADVNTDRMRIAHRRATRPLESQNLARLHDAPVDANDFAQDVLAGFRTAYGILERGRDALLSETGPLSTLKGQQVRFIFRNTNLYATLLERTLHPKYLRDPLDRAIQFDVLARPLLKLAERPALWPVLAAERDALGRMDIPCFSLAADSRSLCLPDGMVIPDCFDRSARDEAVVRLASLGAADLDRQVGFIRAAFAANARRTVAFGSPRDLTAHDGTALETRVDACEAHVERVGSTTPFPLRQIATAYAMSVRAELLSCAFESPTGELSWAAATYVPAARRYVVGPLGPSVFDGYLGLALFFSATDLASGGGRRVAESIAASLVDHLDDLRRGVIGRKRVDIGVGTGLGSTIFALVHLASLRAGNARDAALAVAAMIAPELIADAGSVDALSGVSGAILGLLACHAAHPSSDCLERATWCGDEILRRRDAAASSKEWSLTPGRAPESGMAHGYSGVALALARLSHVTNDERYRDAALDALARERTLMRAVPEPGRHALSWASGCVGVGLARLSMSALIDDRELDDDLECALHAVCLALDAEGRDGVTSNDSLCDGRAGALEFLRLASVQLSRPSLADRAHALARAISGNRDGAASGLGWQHGYSHPGLMEGRAGIAYSLLRASVPSLPSVLVWL